MPTRKALAVSAVFVAALSSAPTRVHASIRDHAAWDQFLQKHVKNGQVDYDTIKSRPSELRSYLKGLAETPRGEFYSASKKTRLAFWINAYNAFTIRLIVDHYPVASIWDITPIWKRPLGGPFVEKFIPLGHLFPGEPLQRRLSLNDIEHEILRKDFDEPRVHFTVVCASTSCPALSDHAYRAATLERQLTDAAHVFLTDSSKNHYDTASNTLHLSRIFSWFREDFERHGSLAGFILPYVDPATARSLEESKTAPRIEFNSYDWSLNRPPNAVRRDARADIRDSG